MERPALLRQGRKCDLVLLPAAAAAQAQGKQAGGKGHKEQGEEGPRWPEQAERHAAIDSVSG